MKHFVPLKKFYDKFIRCTEFVQFKYWYLVVNQGDATWNI